METFDINEALLLAARNGDLSELRKAISKGVDVNTVNKYGWTPLHSAAQEGHTAIVELLLKKESIDVNAKDEYERTPLHVAALKGHFDVVELLLQTPGIETECNIQNQDEVAKIKAVIQKAQENIEKRKQFDTKLEQIKTAINTITEDTDTEEIKKTLDEQNDEFKDLFKSYFLTEFTDCGSNPGSASIITALDKDVISNKYTPEERLVKIKQDLGFTKYKKSIIGQIGKPKEYANLFFAHHLNEEQAKELINQCFDGFAQIIASDGYAIAYSKLQSQEANVSTALEDAYVHGVQTKEGGYCNIM